MDHGRFTVRLSNLIYLFNNNAELSLHTTNHSCNTSESSQQPRAKSQEWTDYSTDNKKAPQDARRKSAESDARCPHIIILDLLP